MKKMTFLILFILGNIFATSAIVSKTISIDTPGTLKSSLTSTELSTITNLTITGTIDARDFKTMRDDMPRLSDLNIFNVAIAAYDGSNGPDYENGYSANTIPASSFYSANNNTGSATLMNITFPKSITKIGRQAFMACKMLSGALNIPSTVEAIGSAAFKDCENLSGDLVLPSSISNIDSYAFYGCSGFTGELVIPNSIEIIAESTFAYCSNFTSLILPESITTIENNAFARCTKISNALTIPNSVQQISAGAFAYCSSLASITIPETTINIDYTAFNSSSGEVNVESSNPNFYSLNGIFFNKDITSLIHCPVDISGILDIPESITSIEANAFSSCKSLIGPFNIPESVTKIGDYAFAYCENLTGELSNLPNLTEIGYGAFANCKGLTAINIQSSVVSIGSFAFSLCSGISYINANQTPPVDISSSMYVFQGVPKTSCVLYVPSNWIDSYKMADQWKDFINIMEIPAPNTPGVPYRCTANAINEAAYVNFIPPPQTGGSEILTYTATSEPEGILATSSSSPIVVRGLTNGTAYTFTVTATNASNTSLPSLSTNAIIPLSVPDAPTDVIAVAGNSEVSVSFAPPLSNGGSEITNYIITATPGGKSVSTLTSPVLITGLTNGVSYSFTVKAYNEKGASLASSPSSSVTPSIPTSVKSNFKDNIQIYLNPTNSKLYINGINGTATISIISTNGKSILTTSARDNDQISIENLPIGFYLVKISTSSNTLVKRILKQ